MEATALIWVSKNLPSPLSNEYVQYSTMILRRICIIRGVGGLVIAGWAYSTRTYEGAMVSCSVVDEHLSVEPVCI